MWGAASIPRTPPRSAHAASTSSGFIRGVGQTARAPACVTAIGLADASIASKQVRSLACETSMRMPSAFMRSTARRPNVVNPASRGSFRPLPKALESAPSDVGARIATSFSARSWLP